MRRLMQGGECGRPRLLPGLFGVGPGRRIAELGLGQRRRQRHADLARIGGMSLKRQFMTPRIAAPPRTRQIYNIYTCILGRRGMIRVARPKLRLRPVSFV